MPQASPQCELLAALVDPQRWGDMEGALEELYDAADWQDAQSTGRVLPKEGADETYDVACAELAAVEEKIQVGPLLVRHQHFLGYPVMSCVPWRA